MPGVRRLVLGEQGGPHILHGRLPKPYKKSGQRKGKHGQGEENKAEKC